MEHKKFISMDKFHEFSINIIEEIAFFKIERIEPSQYKTFLLTLKKGFEYMLEHNVLYVKQQINKEDKELFKTSTFIELEDGLIVKTCINEFLFELCDALGINRL